MKIMGVDPGKTTGIAVINIDENKKFSVGYFEESKDMTLLEINHIIGQCDIIVCEDFVVDPRKDFGGDRMSAPQVIGALKVQCQLQQKPLVLQSRTTKPVGYGLSGQKYTAGKKGMHNQDALAHAVYYGVQKGLCLPFSKKN